MTKVEHEFNAPSPSSGESSQVNVELGLSQSAGGNGSTGVANGLQISLGGHKVIEDLAEHGVLLSSIPRDDNQSWAKFME